LTDVSDKASVHLDSLSLTDSAFCELETVSACSRNAAHHDLHRPLHASTDVSICHSFLSENFPRSSLCFAADCCEVDSTVELQSVEKLHCSNACVKLSSFEEVDTLDRESLSPCTRCDSSLSTLELSVSGISDKSIIFGEQDEVCEIEQVTGGSLLLHGSCCDNVRVAQSSNAISDAVGTHPQLLQHRPLLFFIIGLFVGLSVGFFACECTTAVRE